MKRKALVGLLLVMLLLLGNQVLSVGTAQAALPSRQANYHQGKADHPSPIGATIELHATTSVTPQAWHAVQWQDSSGGWHDVGGWQGHLSDGSRWWVDAKDFGTGPFRWVTRDDANGPVLENSLPFQLPDEAGQILWVTMTPQG